MSILQIPDLVDWANLINRNSPLAERMVSCWLAIPGRGGYGSTTWLDFLGVQNGTLTNMSPTTDWDVIKQGWAGLSFDGGTDYVNIGTSTAYRFTGPFTIAVIYDHTTSTDGNFLGKIVNTWDYSIRVSQINELISFGYSTNSGSSQDTTITWPASSIAGGLDPLIGKRVTVVCTYDGTNAAIYIPVIGKKNSAAASAPTTNTDGLAFGARGTNSETNFVGEMNGVMIWNRGFSESDAKCLGYQIENYFPDMFNRIPIRYFYSEQAVGGGGSAVIAALSNYCNVIIQ